MALARSLTTFIAGLVVGAAALTAFSQEKKEDAPAGAPPMDEMMKKWKEIATPGPKHKALEPMIGNWDTVTRMWMQPGTPPSVEKGTATMRWVMDGRFVESRHSGSMMGQPFEGLGYTGYDNFRKRYTNVWFDSMGTYALTSEGTFDKSGSVLHTFGKLDEWMDGTVGKNVRYTTRLLGPDKMVFEWHDLDIGEAETKVIEVEYTRRK